MALNDEELQALSQGLAVQEETAAAQQNLFRHSQENGDRTAKLYAMAQRLGEVPKYGEEAYDAMSRRYAASVGVDYMGSPMVRRILADDRLSRLVADSPDEWERLSLWDRFMGQAIQSGRVARSATEGVRNLTQPDAAPARPADFVNVDESDSAAFAALDLDLDDIIRKAVEADPDSLLTKRYRNAQENVARRNQEISDQRRLGAAQVAQARLDAAMLSTPDALQRIADAQTFADALSEIAADPFGTIVYSGVQSVAAGAEEMAGAAVGAMVNPALGAFLLGNASYRQEFGATYLSTLEDAGIDTTNREEILKAIQDPALRHRAEQRALSRALVVSSFDTAAGAIAGFSMKPVSKAMALRRFKPSTMARDSIDVAAAMNARGFNTTARAARTEELIRALSSRTPAVDMVGEGENLLWQTLVGGAMGGAGEALGSIAIGDEVNIGDVVLEAFADMYTAPIDVATMRSKAIAEATIDRAKVLDAHSLSDAIQATVQLQDGSKLNARSPNDFSNEIQKNVEGTKFGTVAFAASDLQGFAQDLVNISPTIAAQWKEAEATGGDIVIPFGELFRIRSQNQEAFNAISENIRINSDGMSLREAEEFEAEFEPGLRQRVEELAETTGQSVARRTRSATALYQALEPVRQELLAAGRPQSEVNSAIAIQAAILENIAGLSGLSVDEWLQENPLTVRSAEEAQQGFAQSPTEFRRGLFDPNSRTINLFRAADESTFIHESAHYWLDAMVRHAIVTRQPADALASKNLEGQKLNQLLSDFFSWAEVPGMKEGGLPEALKRWNEGGIEFQRPYHEKFARGFEAYLMEGRAPTNSLKKAFERFVSWLKSIYVNASALGVEMSPEVIDLYDRLFVSEQAVIDAKVRMGETGVYNDLIKAGMKEAEFRNFVDLQAAAREEAEAKVRSAMSRDALAARSRRVREERGLQKEYEALVKAEKDAIYELDQFRALHAFMSHGVKGEDGTVMHFKFPYEDYRKAMNEENAKWVSARRMVSEDGTGKNYALIDPEYAAQIFGFDSVDEMVNAMRAAYDEKDIDAMAEESASQKFLEQYGEAPTAVGIGRLAAQATQEAAALDVLATEAAALKRAMGRVKPFKQAVERFAKQAVMRKRLGIETLSPSGRPVRRGLSSAGYVAAANRAGRKAEKLFVKGDTIGAAEAKQAQVIQTALAKEIDAALVRVERFRRRLSRALKSETIETPYQVQIAKLANAMGLGGKPYPQEATIDEFVNGRPASRGRTEVSAHPELKAVYDAIPQSMFAEDGTFRPRPIEAMTVEEFDAVSALFNGLEKSGRAVMATKRLEQIGTAANILDQAQKTLNANMDALGREKFRDDGGARFGQQAKRMARGFFFKHISFTRFLQILDKNQQGFFTKTIGWAANDCANHESSLLKEYGDLLNDALRPLYKNLNRDVAKLGETRYTKQQVASILMNAGNAGNKDRLRTGNGLSEEDVKKLARSLSAEEIRSVQKVWDIFEKIRILAAEKSRRVDGVEPEWVTAEPLRVVSKEGETIELKGGYCPISYDPRGSHEAAFFDLQKQLDAERAAGYLAAQTSRTYTKQRVPKIEREMPLRLDLGVVGNGLSEVIHDVCWSEYVSDFNRLWRGVTERRGDETVHHEGLGELIFDYFGQDGAMVGQEWIKAIAMNGPTVTDTTSAIASRIRQGVSVAGLGFNVVSALVQVTGLISASSRLGPARMLSGVAEFASNPKHCIQYVNSVSEFMRNRSNTRNREIYEVQSIVAGKPSRWVDFQNLAYAMMMKVQAIVDYSAWNAAYRQAIEDGRTEADAVHFADQEVINTQGSGMIKDRSQIENMGSWGQIFLSFYSYMGTAYNLGAMSLIGEESLKKKAAQLSTVFFVQPILEAILRDALKQDEGEDDEEKTAFDVIRFGIGASVGFTLGTTVFTREFAGGIQNLITGEPVYGWRGPSGARIVSDTYGLAQQLAQGDLDEGLAHSVLNVAGSTIGIPAAQIWRLWTGIDAYFVSDVTDNPLTLLTGYQGERK